MTEPSLLSTREAREHLGIGKTLLFKLIKNGDLKPVRIGRKTMITPAEIDRYLATLNAR